MSKFDQYRNGNFGVNALSHEVSRYCLRADNEGERSYARMSVIAEDVYRKIVRERMRVYKQKVVLLDGATSTFHYPSDCLRIVRVDWLDADNRRHYMEHDASINTKKLEVSPTAKCKCQKCNCTVDFCSSFSSNTLTEEDVTINGQVYKKVTKQRICPNGDIMQEITEPYGADAGQIGDEASVMGIQYRTREVLIEKLEMKDCGCIADTPENLRKCAQYCGVPPSCSSDECEKYFQQREGKYRDDSETQTVYVWDCNARYALVSYVSNGEGRCEEIMIPEYYRDALYAGMFYFSIQFKTNIGAYEKRMADDKFDQECMELVKFENPIDMEAIRETQDTFTKW
jgi:hypothetical protein